MTLLEELAEQERLLDQEAEHLRQNPPPEEPWKDRAARYFAGCDPISLGPFDSYKITFLDFNATTPSVPGMK